MTSISLFKNCENASITSWYVLILIIMYMFCHTSQKMKIPLKGFFSKCDQIRSFLPIWSHLPEKSLMETSFFVQCQLQRMKEKKKSFLSWIWLPYLKSFSSCQDNVAPFSKNKRYASWFGLFHFHNYLEWDDFSHYEWKFNSERDNPCAYALLSVSNPTPCTQTLKQSSDIV